MSSPWNRWKARGEYVIVQNPPGFITHEERSGRETTKAAGKRFLVTVLRRGDHWGLGDKLIYDQDEPQIEVWDLSWAGKSGFDDRGQFVSRYYAFTVAEMPLGRGIDLVGYEPAWKIDGHAWGSVIALAKSVTYGEKAWQEGLRRKEEALRRKDRGSAARKTSMLGDAMVRLLRGK